MNTKVFLANAIYELLQEKSFEKITVQMILERSGMSRGTFYRYFRDKYELMSWYYQLNVDKSLNKSDGTNWDVLILEIFTFVRDTKTYTSKVMKVEGPNSFMNFLHQYTVDFYKRNYMKRRGIQNLSLEEKFCIDFTSAGQLYVLRDWVLRGFKEPVEEVSKIVYDLMPAMLSPYF